MPSPSFKLPVVLSNCDFREESLICNEAHEALRIWPLLVYPIQTSWPSKLTLVSLSFLNPPNSSPPFTWCSFGWKVLSSAFRIVGGAFSSLRFLLQSDFLRHEGRTRSSKIIPTMCPAWCLKGAKKVFVVRIMNDNALDHSPCRITSPTGGPLHPRGRGLGSSPSLIAY